MPDQIFANPRLAEIYDYFDSDRSDLDLYLAILDELGALAVLDLGCGTGSLASLMAKRGLSVVGVDPAAASLELAKKKPGAEVVRWIHGDATNLPELTVDAAVMTGNVGQVFVSDESWMATLQGLALAVRPDGHLVFEVRDPAKQAWLGWIRERTESRLDIPKIGPVTSWIQVTEVSLPYVTFESRYQFEADNSELVSTSTLRFREKEEIESSLAATGFEVQEVRDAPDRPGKEWVFVARRLS